MRLVHRLRGIGSLAPIAAAVALLLVPGPALAASPQPLTVSLSTVELRLDSAGSLTVALALVDENGSALRYAMDGNFTPLVNSLPLNASTRSQILLAVSLAELDPLLAGYFGNRDGTVSPGEVTLFSSLIVQESQLLPSGSLLGTGLISLTLDGHPPSSSSASPLSFTGATGPDTSPAPITIGSTVTLGFPYSGHSHRLAIVPNASLPASTNLSADLAFTTPSACSITAWSGFGSGSASNDPLGWGSGTFRGSYTPAPGENATIDFASSFPTGDVILIVVPVAAVVGVLAFLLVRRRRRAAASPPATFPP